MSLYRLLLRINVFVQAINTLTKIRTMYDLVFPTFIAFFFLLQENKWSINSIRLHFVPASTRMINKTHGFFSCPSRVTCHYFKRDFFFLFFFN